MPPKQSSRAKNDYQRARDAVDRIFTRVAEDLVNVPGMEKIRRALLADALEFYESFLAAHGDDPNVRHETARTGYRVGSIHWLIGDFNRVEAPVPKSRRPARRFDRRRPTRPGLQARSRQVPHAPRPGL